MPALPRGESPSRCFPLIPVPNLLLSVDLSQDFNVLQAANQLHFKSIELRGNLAVTPTGALDALSARLRLR